MEQLEAFISDCLARGLTRHTTETYRSQVKSFLHACPEPTEVNIDKLKAILGGLRAKNLTGSTLKGYFAAVSTFYEYLIFEGIAIHNPIPGFRKRYLSRIREQYNGENCRQLISVIDMQRLVFAAFLTGIQERALMMVLAKTGIRKGELLGLKIENINLNVGTILLPSKPKRTNRTVFIDDELSEVLSEYIIWRAPRARSSWLWISKRGGRIHKDYPNKIITSIAKPLNLHDPEGQLCSKLTCHCFRHWFTTHLYRAGMKDQYIKWLRGDSLNKEAWQGYNRIDPWIVRREYLQCIPKLLTSVPPAAEIPGDITKANGQKTILEYL